MAQVAAEIDDPSRKYGVWSQACNLDYLVGNLASAADNDSSLTFTYDVLGRLSQAQTVATVAQPATTITYTYDKKGNRKTMTDPQGGVTSHVYDASNRLTMLTSPQGASTFSYDALGRRTGLTLPNATSATYTYDAASQLTSLKNLDSTALLLSKFDYTYDAVGNRITRTTTNGVANYDYDDLNRLFNATQPDPVDPLQQLTETFQYDSVGNRTNSHLATGQVYDAANRLLEDSNFTFSSDANGNLIEKIDKTNGDRTVYTYNVDNQLIRVGQFTVAGGGTPIVVADYRYDALGRRIEKVVNGVATRYVYDDEDILLDLDGSNQVIARYTHGPGIDEPLVMARGGQSFFYHVDGLGSIWDLTDAAGTFVRSYTYDSFGQIVGQTGTLINPYTYTGREFDPETGLYYYRARYYDPTIGRFLEQDPLGSLGRRHLYSYTQNDPINFVDPFGLQRIFAPVDIEAEIERNRAIRESLPSFVPGLILDLFFPTTPEGVEQLLSDTIVGLVCPVGGPIRQGGDLLGKIFRKEVELFGGRDGGRVKNLVGPPNSIVRGSGRRVFVTDDTGRVVLDITRERVKSVTPGRGFGPKRPPTAEELKVLEEFFGASP